MRIPTRPAGKQANEALSVTGLDVTQVILSGQPWVAADESSIAEVLRALNGQELARWLRLAQER